MKTMRGEIKVYWTARHCTLEIKPLIYLWNRGLEEKCLSRASGRNLVSCDINYNNHPPRFLALRGAIVRVDFGLQEFLFPCLVTCWNIPVCPLFFLHWKKKNEEENFHKYNLLTHSRSTHECFSVVKPMDKDSLFKKKES